MMDRSDTVVVVGGGIIGAMTAYFLSQKGYAVTIIERGLFGYGASHGNCGLIIPHHILPLNSLGNLSKALRRMFKKDAPLLILPRIDPNLLLWLAQFAHHCRRQSVMISVLGRSVMLSDAIALYERLIQEEELNCDWGVTGALHVFRSIHEWKCHEKADVMAVQFGVGGKMMSREISKQMEPALGNEIAGAWFYDWAATLRPDTLMIELKRILQHRNVVIIEQTEVKSFHLDGRRVATAITNHGKFTARQFVVTAGAWTPLVAKMLGCRIPIQPGKGYSMTFKRSSGSPSIPCFFEETKTVVTPWSSGLRLGGTMEFAGYDDHLKQSRLDLLYRAAGRYLHNIDLSNIEEEWCGWRPMTFDGLPIIDRVPGLDNVIIAAGHNMEGLAMAPGTGKLVAEMISGERLHIEPHPYRISRFYA